MSRGVWGCSGEDADDVRLARAAWSRLAEPGDPLAGAVVSALGPVTAWRWAREAARAVTTGGLPPVEGLHLGAASVRRLAPAVARWSPRLADVDPHRDLEALSGIGGHLVVPEDAGWPVALDALGAAAPACLWVRGSSDLAGALQRAVAVIGARASSGYGEHVAAGLASGLALRGWTVVSGGAYGIDAVAHRAALAGPGRTVAVLAGGVDRPYPAGNARLLQAVIEAGGSVVAEVPPGSVPSRSRFLQRNRLIAAAGAATVVVEAAWRSGALNTASHALALLRPVGAVPGPVTSATSAGCHRLLRDGGAVCVTDVAEVVELVGALDGEPVAVASDVRAGPADDLTSAGRRLLDALPVRRGADPTSLARVGGLSMAEVRAGLGQLELAGLAEQDGGRWRLTRRPRGQNGQTGTSPAAGDDGVPRRG